MPYSDKKKRKRFLSNADARSANLRSSASAIPIITHVRRYQMAMLEHLAQEASTTVSAVLTRELEGCACARAEELSAALRGFAVALEWPHAIETLPAC